MKYEQAREILPLHADGELDPVRAAELENDLEQSRELREELEHWRELRRCANRVFAATPVPTGLEARIRVELRRARARARYRVAGWASGITAIAAGIVVMVFLWVPGPQLVTADAIARTYFDCAVRRTHRGVEVDLGNVSSARAKLNGLATYTVMVPDLESMGFELNGVCRCSHVPGVKLYHVSYRRSVPGPGPAVVSFFSLDSQISLKDSTTESRVVSADSQSRDYQTAKYKDALVCKWDVSKQSFAVCCEVKPEQLRELIDGIQTASLKPYRMILARAD